MVIADDIQILRQGLKAILEQDGDIEVTGLAGDGLQAFLLCKEKKPDVALMDMRMPRMDGDEATREIRALDRPDAATLPIIAETADAFEEGQRRARDAGMTALTTKPLNIHELMALLAEHIPEK